MQLTLDRASPGMILAEDMRDAGGNLLLKSGTSLTESILASLQRYDMGSFTVAGGESDPVDDTAARELIQRRLAKLFRGCGDNLANRLLRDSLSEYRLGKLHD